MTILSISPFAWSWGAIAERMLQPLEDRYRILHKYWQGHEQINDIADQVDVVLVQNINQLRRLKRVNNVIARCGGMRTFEGSTGKYARIMSKAWGIIATNKQLYDISKGINPNTFLITNGTDLELFKPVDRKPRRKFVVGFVGNLSSPSFREYKGYDMLEMAVETLSKELKREVELKPALYGAGQLPYTEMPAYYNELDCLVHPSKNEGCSNTIVEALACGVPVITTKVAYHGENLTEGENCLFVRRETGDIAEKIKTLIRNPALRKKLSVNGRAFAEKHHDSREIVRYYEELFRRCYKATHKVEKKKGIRGIMEIKYTGPKPQKLIMYNNQHYVFNPTCVVYDQPTIDFLLARDKNGLFEQVLSPPPDKTKPEKIEIPEPEEKNPAQCEICGFVAKSEFGLKAHIRGKHKRGNK